MNRRIFNHPIRKETTLEFYPEKIDIKEFWAIICDDFVPFMANMEQLGGKAIELKYIEGWVEQYLAWLEIEEER